MKVYEKQLSSVFVRCVCDACGAEHDNSNFELQEFVHISFRGGYGSIFGDGNLVEGDLCQACVKQLLGPFLRVTELAPWNALNTLSSQESS